MNKKKILLGLLGAGSVLAMVRLAASRAATSKPALQPYSHSAVDYFIKEEMRRLHIPGAALAIVEGDRITHVRSFGLARPGGQAPSPQTLFFIGSLTKSFTALAVMQLVEAGKIALDAPVQRYLPWFRVSDPQASCEMTVRHLLNQTSGLPALAGEIVLADLDGRHDATERQVRALAALKITRPVGSKCEYSNLNYNILGLIVEAASGESYANFIQSHIFDPLEMRHSYTSRDVARQHGLAMGHRHWFSRPFPAPNLLIPRGSLPSGQLISCAEDMAHYLIAHLNGGLYGNTQVLSPAGIDELHRGEKDYIVMGISSGKYAMGWFDQDIDGTKTYSHAGNVPDFSAFMAILPEQKQAVVLLLNADPYGLPPITEELGLNLTRLLAGQTPVPNKLDFIQWVMRLLPLVPLFQVVDILATLRRVHRWRVQPGLRPSRGRLWGEHILPPLIPNLALVGALGYLQSTGLLRFLNLFMPDVAWISLISGTLAGIWGVLRTVLLIRQPATKGSTERNIR
jgi:CubicO group peptidase (beta-lactamase class C family)